MINFLLTTEIIPLCLGIMESGNELSKTVATFILQKILLDDSGLNYICQTYDRFSHVAMILGKMVLSLAKEPRASRNADHVFSCVQLCGRCVHSLDRVTVYPRWRLTPPLLLGFRSGR